jgi:hypothetical protein
MFIEVTYQKEKSEINMSEEKEFIGLEWAER